MARKMARNGCKTAGHLSVYLFLRHPLCGEQVSSKTNTQIIFLITESGYIFIQLCNSYLQKWGRRKGEQCRFSERVVGRKKGRRDIKDLFCLVFCAQFDDFFYAKSSVDSLKWHT